MPTVWIPTMMQSLTGGERIVTVQGGTIREVIDNLDTAYPGLKERLMQNGALRPDLAVAVDGELTPLGLYQPVSESTEVLFVPEIGGG